MLVARINGDDRSAISPEAVKHNCRDAVLSAALLWRLTVRELIRGDAPLIVKSGFVLAVSPLFPVPALWERGGAFFLPAPELLHRGDTSSLVVLFNSFLVH
jgi:hypothetical protein